MVFVFDLKNTNVAFVFNLSAKKLSDFDVNTATALLFDKQKIGHFSPIGPSNSFEISSLIFSLDFVDWLESDVN